MTTALIGYSGFVGSTLDTELKPDERYRSANIADIRGRSFDHVICAGVQAMKWWANLHPEQDWAGIAPLLEALGEVRTKRLTLISTIDVYPSPQLVNEDSSIETATHHAYGRHRLEVEAQIRALFDRVCILRLPGLFGPNLKKNVIFDMINGNQLEKVHPEGCFQYYDTRRLGSDIRKAWVEGLELLNISSEPVFTSEIRDRFFPNAVLGGEGPAPQGYDMRSKHADRWGGENGYLYSKGRILADLECYLQHLR